jgi:hypothetical protein
MITGNGTTRHHFKKKKKTVDLHWRVGEKKRGHSTRGGFVLCRIEASIKKKQVHTYMSIRIYIAVCCVVDAIHHLRFRAGYSLLCYCLMEKRHRKKKGWLRATAARAGLAIQNGSACVRVFLHVHGRQPPPPRPSFYDAHRGGRLTESVVPPPLLQRRAEDCVRPLLRVRVRLADSGTTTPGGAAAARY